MKLGYVEVCGFRGFRDKIRIDFGGGFTIITGRNGVGKSTLFDAVEFAITGVIEKYAVEKAAKESLADYLWWRGAGEPEAHYVTASFIRETAPHSKSRGPARPAPIGRRRKSMRPCAAGPRLTTRYAS